MVFSPLSKENWAFDQFPKHLCRALLSLVQFISPERVPSKYFIDEKCYLAFAKQLLKGALGKVMYTKCYTGIGNLVCLNSKVFSKVVNNLNWNCKYLHFESLWILAGLNVLLWPLISYMELMTMRNVTYRIKVSWSLWINVSKIFAFVYSTNTQCKFLLHLRWLLCWKEEAVHFR